MKRIFGAYLLVMAALFITSAAQAEEKEKHEACRADVQKLCKGVQPGGGRIAACLKQHESELAPGCRERMAEARKEGKEFSEACKADAETLCKGVQPGQGRVMRCLVEHKDKLSGGCLSKISEAESHHPCMKDMERLCKGVQPGAGRMAQCMKQHEAQLSPECKARHAERNGGDKK
jgi:Cysteine rich repeat